MPINIYESTADRLHYIADMSWAVLFSRIASGRTIIDGELSLQLHYSIMLTSFGELLCINPTDIFTLKIGSLRKKNSIDIVFGIENKEIAIELKCFLKKSNRPIDTDMYDALSDVEQLLSHKDYESKKFICLTDNSIYATGPHLGHAGSVTIMEGTQYLAENAIKPSWVGRWKDRSRDNPICLSTSITCNWIKKSDWYYLKLDL